MRDIAIIAYGSDVRVEAELVQSEVEMVNPVVTSTIEQSGLEKREIDILVSGSSDYIAGAAFSFLNVLDAIGPSPSMDWSHVETDAAFALYEAWVRLQSGDIDTALVFGFTTATRGDTDRVLNLQFDPYYVAPLGISSVGGAALQARALLDASIASERDFAAVAAARRAAGDGARGAKDRTVEQLLEERPIVSPLRPHACPRLADGAAAIVLAAADIARSVCDRPAWIRDMDHRIETPALGARDLTASTSTARSLHETKALDEPPDVVELHAPFASQEVVLCRELDLEAGDPRLNASGGALVADPVMVTGLIRVGEAARRLVSGEGRRAVAHATCGPCLQQNLVAVLEAD